MSVLLSGLQLGYFFQGAGRDYIIFEKNSTAGIIRSVLMGMMFQIHLPHHFLLFVIIVVSYYLPQQRTFLFKLNGECRVGPVTTAVHPL